MPLTTTIPSSATESFITQSDYIEAKALSAGAAERITVPTGAKFALFSGSDNFAAKAGGSSVEAAWPSDTTDGSASMLNPAGLVLIEGQTHISVVSNSSMVLTVAFYDNTP
jgi:hypothetical protein